MRQGQLGVNTHSKGLLAGSACNMQHTVWSKAAASNTSKAHSCAPLHVQRPHPLLLQEVVEEVPLGQLPLLEVVGAACSGHSGRSNA